MPHIYIYISFESQPRHSLSKSVSTLRELNADQEVCVPSWCHPSRVQSQPTEPLCSTAWFAAWKSEPQQPDPGTMSPATLNEREAFPFWSCPPSQLVIRVPKYMATSGIDRQPQSWPQTPLNYLTLNENKNKNKWKWKLSGTLRKGSIFRIKVSIGHTVEGSD